MKKAAQGAAFFIYTIRGRMPLPKGFDRLSCIGRGSSLLHGFDHFPCKKKILLVLSILRFRFALGERSYMPSF